MVNIKRYEIITILLTVTLLVLHWKFASLPIDIHENLHDGKLEFELDFLKWKVKLSRTRTQQLDEMTTLASITTTTKYNEPEEEKKMLLKAFGLTEKDIAN